LRKPFRNGGISKNDHFDLYLKGYILINPFKYVNFPHIFLSPPLMKVIYINNLFKGGFALQVADLLTNISTHINITLLNILSMLKFGKKFMLINFVLST